MFSSLMVHISAGAKGFLCWKVHLSVGSCISCVGTPLLLQFALGLRIRSGCLFLGEHLLGKLLCEALGLGGYSRTTVCNQIAHVKCLSAFLKHAFREVTCGFCKGTVPGAPPLPSPGPLRMPKNNSKETYLVPPEGHISVKNM